MSFADWSHMLILTRNPLLPPSSPPERASRRVVLVPQSQGGTPASIQDPTEPDALTTVVDPSDSTSRHQLRSRHSQGV